MARLQEKYREEVFPQLQKEFELTNPMQVPKISKITCNIGVGEASRNAKLLDVAMEQLANITGQLPEVRKARKSIAASSASGCLEFGTSAESHQTPLTVAAITRSVSATFWSFPKWTTRRLKEPWV